MSDLVKRLLSGESCLPDNKCRIMDTKSGCLCAASAARIQELERELAIAERMAMDANEAYSQAHVAMCDALDQLAAEKALADQVWDALHGHDTFAAMDAYRKARGM